MKEITNEMIGKVANILKGVNVGELKYISDEEFEYTFEDITYSIHGQYSEIYNSTAWGWIPYKGARVISIGCSYDRDEKNECIGFDCT